MENLAQLKAIYTALGGSSATVANMTDNASVLAQIALQAAIVATAASTAELPTVAAADNGKVLTVVNGAWAAAALPE